MGHLDNKVADELLNKQGDKNDKKIPIQNIM